MRFKVFSFDLLLLLIVFFDSLSSMSSGGGGGGGGGGDDDCNCLLCIIQTNTFFCAYFSLSSFRKSVTVSVSTDNNGTQIISLSMACALSLLIDTIVIPNKQPRKYRRLISWAENCVPRKRQCQFKRSSIQVNPIARYFFASFIFNINWIYPG